jgi:sensor histidine kinase YesM
MKQQEFSASFSKMMNPKGRTREFIIRFTIITIISFISPFLDFGAPSNETDFLKAFLVSFVRTALLWNGSMLIIQFLIERYSVFKETIKLVVYQVVVLSVFVSLVELAELYAIKNFLNITLSSIQKTSLFLISLIITFMISSIYASVAFFIEWKENLMRAQALEKANLEARYDTLRNQVNPHFLFNSLNTLLMLVNDNPVASRYVESISEIMRYMLQSRDKEAVLLRDELNIAKEYVYIQQNRFGDKLIVEIDVPEQFYHYAIPPLAIQMLLENTLKHNVVSKEHPLFVKVYISPDKYLVVENNLKSKIDKEPSTGVGLENIRNRYLFLTGKDIVVKQVSGKFVVMLPLFEKSI